MTKKLSRCKKTMIIILSVILGIFVVFGIVYACFCGSGGSYYNDDGTYKHVSQSNSYKYIMNHPAFEGFGQNILPWQDGALVTLTSSLRVRFLMPMLVTRADTNKVIESFNYMIDYCNETKNQLFYDYYTDADKITDASKKDTGLVFLKGKADMPFALVCPGGGYVNVEANHEGYPVAQVLHEKGYSVFILRYRVRGSYKIKGSTTKSNGHNEDAANALRYIIENADTFGVPKENYSTWGFSAGGDVAGTLANPENEFGYANYVETAPAAAFLGYPVPSTQSLNSCPLFITMAKNDDMIDFSEVESWVNKLIDKGVSVTIDFYETGSHGYGTGYGTEADGWMDKAIAFWEKQINESH